MGSLFGSSAGAWPRPAAQHDQRYHHPHPRRATLINRIWRVGAGGRVYLQSALRELAQDRWLAGSRRNAPAGSPPASRSPSLFVSARPSASSTPTMQPPSRCSICSSIIRSSLTTSSWPTSAPSGTAASSPVACRLKREAWENCRMTVSSRTPRMAPARLKTARGVLLRGDGPERGAVVGSSLSGHGRC